MMLTFYTFKNKTNETLVKNPGDIDGQMFDIADCDNCTLVVMDYCEQVQIDEVKNSRIFIGACVSSIFIRNCSNCVFYTCCRQLRLREVVNSSFYIHSMAEVHIEYSNSVSFAPFNGGYPQHEQHLRSANLDPTHNLWYDIFDHNDPERSRVNWSLIPQEKYEPEWFPAGSPCPVAIPKTIPGSVQRVEESSSMQSFSVQQLIADAQALNVVPPNPSALPPSPPVASVVNASVAPVPPPSTPETVITSLLTTFTSAASPISLLEVLSFFTDFNLSLFTLVLMFQSLASDFYHRCIGYYSHGRIAVDGSICNHNNSWFSE